MGLLLGMSRFDLDSYPLRDFRNRRMSFSWVRAAQFGDFIREFMISRRRASTSDKPLGRARQPYIHRVNTSPPSNGECGIFLDGGVLHGGIFADRREEFHRSADSASQGNFGPDAVFHSYIRSSCGISSPRPTFNRTGWRAYWRGSPWHGREI